MIGFIGSVNVFQWSNLQEKLPDTMGDVNLRSIMNRCSVTLRQSWFRVAVNMSGSQGKYLTCSN